jgi:hypothetical protein
LIGLYASAWTFGAVGETSIRLASVAFDAIADVVSHPFMSMMLACAAPNATALADTANAAMVKVLKNKVIDFS